MASFILSWKRCIENTFFPEGGGNLELDSTQRKFYPASQENARSNSQGSLNPDTDLNTKRKQFGIRIWIQAKVPACSRGSW